MNYREPALEKIYENMYIQEEIAQYSDTNPNPDRYSFITDPFKAEDFAYKFYKGNTDLIQKIPQHIIETMAKNPSVAMNWFVVVTNNFKLTMSYPIVHQEIIDSIASDPEQAYAICKMVGRHAPMQYSRIPSNIRKVGEERGEYWRKYNQPPKKSGILHSINKTLFGG